MGMERGFSRQKNAVHTGPESGRCLALAKQRPLWLEPREPHKVGPGEMDWSHKLGPEGHDKSLGWF